MKVLTPLFILLLFFNGKARAQDTIFWRAGDTLTWADFKGTPNFSTRYLAASSTGISYSFRYSDNGLIFSVSAFFVRNRSWRNYGTDLAVLKHEQGHFDITEIYARKLASRLRLLRTDRKTFRKAVEEIGEKTISEKNLMQRKYDHETASGTRRRSQQKWELAIRKQLNAEEISADW